MLAEYLILLEKCIIHEHRVVFGLALLTDAISVPVLLQLQSVQQLQQIKP